MLPSTLIGKLVMTLIPLNSQFRVNTHTRAYQYDSRIAMDADGNFVVSWTGSGEDDKGQGIFAQRYDSFGSPIGKQFVVNSYTTGRQEDPAIAMDDKGRFVILWNSWAQDGSKEGIFAQRYNRSGKPVGEEFQINAYARGRQQDARIAMEDGGNFVVTWTGSRRERGGSGIWARCFNSRGNPLGEDFLVNTYTTDEQQKSNVALDDAGNFVITWDSRDQDGSDNGVFAQRYDSTGTPLGKEFQVNSYATEYQFDPAIAMNAKGDFIIGWASSKHDGKAKSRFRNTYDIYAQRYNSRGKPVGDEFLVNTDTIGSQNINAVSLDDRGNFVILWDSYRRADSPFNGAFAQAYHRDGSPQGEAFRISDSEGYGSSISLTNHGTFAVSWTGKEDDPSVSSSFFGSDVYAQVYVDALIGSNGNDTLSGTAEPDVIQGFQGDDRLSGKGGDDLLVGGRGTNRLSGGGGSDRFVLGLRGFALIRDFTGGKDTLALPDTVTFRQLSITQDQKDTRIEVDGQAIAQLKNIQAELISQNDFIITPDDYVLVGTDGDDDLAGTANPDVIQGLRGDDRLSGKGGGDLLMGGRGTNQISGGGGRDRFVLEPRGFAVIHDFTAGEDTLVLPYEVRLGTSIIQDRKDTHIEFSGQTIAQLKNVQAEFINQADLIFT